MSETKHTPGPWRVSTGNFAKVIEGQSNKKLHERDDGFRPIATVQSCTDSPYAKEQDDNCAANMALILAAPDMLEALKGLVAPQHTHSAGCSCPWCFARAAIRKAEGRS